MITDAERGARSYSCGAKLLVPEGLDRVEARGLEGGIEPEAHADEGGEDDRHDDRLRLDRDGPAREARDEALDPEPGRDPRGAARHGERDGLDEELRLDVA